MRRAFHFLCCYAIITVSALEALNGAINRVKFLGRKGEVLILYAGGTSLNESYVWRDEQNNFQPLRAALSARY